MHDSRGALLKVGDRVVVEGVVASVDADSGYCNAHVKFVTPEQCQNGADNKPPMTPPGDTFNTRMLTKIGAVVLLALTFASCTCDKCDAQIRRQYSPAPQPSRLDRKVDGSGPQYNSGRAAEAPSAESEKLFMTLITSDSWQNNPREKQVVSWLNNEPRLSRLRGQCRFNWYTQSNPHFKVRLRYKLGDALPILAIQRPDGEAILNVTGLSMPHSGGELADMADDAVTKRFAPPPFAGSNTGTRIVEDVADCPDDSCRPPVPDDEGHFKPIPEVIPKKPVSLVPLYFAVGVFGLASVALVVVIVVVFAWPKLGGKPPISGNQIW